MSVLTQATLMETLFKAGFVDTTNADAVKDALLNYMDELLRPLPTKVVAFSAGVSHAVKPGAEVCAVNDAEVTGYMHSILRASGQARTIDYDTKKLRTVAPAHLEVILSLNSPNACAMLFSDKFRSIVDSSGPSRPSLSDVDDATQIAMLYGGYIMVTPSLPNDGYIRVWADGTLSHHTEDTGEYVATPRNADGTA